MATELVVRLRFDGNPFAGEDDFMAIQDWLDTVTWPLQPEPSDWSLEDIEEDV